MRWLTLLLSLACQSLLAAEWFPYPVHADGRVLDYRPLPVASQPWRICALLPHGKDRYWWGVAWGWIRKPDALACAWGSTKPVATSMPMCKWSSSSIV